MTEPHPDGWRQHPRVPIGKRDPEDRVDDYEEIWAPTWTEAALREQGERCMDCGVATCMAGCPIGNVIPDWNDLVYRADWREALDRLHATNNFPEFTGYTCPAPCEDTCVLAYNDDPVAIKSIERAIVDRGWEEGWIEPEPPATRTEHEVAVVGSGPTGLAAAQQLNRVGHRVTVLERDDALGGMMRYGIPDFKFGKHQVDRRLDQLRAEGIAFETGAEIGENVPAETLVEDYDAACLAVGAQEHKPLPLPGTNLDGVHEALEYLIQVNRRQAGNVVETPIDAGDKHVVVIGGGDTGADCVATAHRQGAKGVVQIDINTEPPMERPPDNPWPQLPKTYHESYAQEEGGRQEFGIDTHALEDVDDDGHVDRLHADRVEWTYDDVGDRVKPSVLESNIYIDADLVLVAIGFDGAEATPFAAMGVRTRRDGTIRTDERKMTDVDGVFAAGDAVRGQSLVVWAIGEGRDVACHIDRYLTGRTDLPPSLESANQPSIT